MKTLALLARTVLCLWTVSAAAGTVQVQLNSRSIKMDPGPCSCGFGLVWKLHFSTYNTDDPQLANGEIASRPPGSATTHWAWMLLEDPSLYGSTTFAEIDLPLNEDSDGNGVIDFFEPERGVAAVTTGSYPSSLGGGTLGLSWQRLPGASEGSCVIYMHDRVLGELGPFQHRFEIIQYTGTLVYQRTGNAISGTVDLQHAGNLLQGPLQMTRSTSDPANLLLVTSGAWTNEAGSFFFDNTSLTRNPSHPSLYQGPLDNPSGSFSAWTLRIVDPNDSNGNGIPDLTDALATTPPQAPTLALRLTADGLELRITGDTGFSYEVQQASSLTSPSWQSVTNFILTSSPKVLTLDTPATGPAFWRTRIPQP